MMKRMLAALAAMLLSAAATSGQAAARTPGHVYAVVIEITLDPEGKYVDAKVSRVVDPASGSTAAVDIPVPDAYLEKARAELAARTYKAGSEHVFMYRYFDPSRPAEVLQTPY